MTMHAIFAMMPWHRILVSSADIEIAKMSATALMEALGKVYRDAGHYLYYLSPQASYLAAEVLSAYSAIPCTNMPTIIGLKRIEL